MTRRGAVRSPAVHGPRLWLDLLRAVAALAGARIRLSAQDPETLFTAPADGAAAGLTPAQSRLIHRVAFALPRAAARVPWRATCLVQALAAQRWLAHGGIASQLRLGARKSAADGLDAHAWLEAGGQVVVGGDVGAYAPFPPIVAREKRPG